jgi:hypothetical protein
MVMRPPPGLGVRSSVPGSSRIHVHCCLAGGVYIKTPNFGRISRASLSRECHFHKHVDAVVDDVASATSPSIFIMIVMVVVIMMVMPSVHHEQQHQRLGMM